jgi:hypothetical protein
MSMVVLQISQMEQSSCEWQMSGQFVDIAVGACDFKSQILTNGTKILRGNWPFAQVRIFGSYQPLLP